MAPEDKGMGELELNDHVSLCDEIGENGKAPTPGTVGIEEAG